MITVGDLRAQLKDWPDDGQVAMLSAGERFLLVSHLGRASMLPAGEHPPMPMLVPTDDSELDLEATAAVPGPVLAASYWPTNGHMVADLHRLGYLLDTDHVLDPTFENGVWWQQWRPAQLTTCHRATDGTDFRHLDFGTHTFDAITFDPPYVCPGGRKTSTMQGFHDRFGMAEGHEDPMFSTPGQLQEIINAGLTEMVRLVKPAGLILVKCQNYIWSGRLFEGAEHTRAHAIGLGCTVVDRLEFLAHPRPQPSTNPDGSDRRQVHARRNLSTLFVFSAPNVDQRQGVLL